MGGISFGNGRLRDQDTIRSVIGCLPGQSAARMGLRGGPCFVTRTGAKDREFYGNLGL
jgi:hypothetical protein